MRLVTHVAAETHFKLEPGQIPTAYGRKPLKTPYNGSSFETRMKSKGLRLWSVKIKGNLVSSLSELFEQIEVTIELTNEESNREDRNSGLAI